MKIVLSNMRKKLQTFWGFLTLSLLVLGLAASVILVTERQEIRKRAAVKCTDSDGGEVKDKRGTATDSTGSYTDYCFRDVVYLKLREYFCKDGKVTYKDIDVATGVNGCEECLDGAIFKYSSNCGDPNACCDSDWENSGWPTQWDIVTPGRITVDGQVFHDKCIDGTRLLEFSCSPCLPGQQCNPGCGPYLQSTEIDCAEWLKETCRETGRLDCEASFGECSGGACGRPLDDYSDPDPSAAACGGWMLPSIEVKEKDPVTRTVTLLGRARTRINDKIDTIEFKIWSSPKSGDEKTFVTAKSVAAQLETIRIERGRVWNEFIATTTITLPAVERYSMYYYVGMRFHTLLYGWQGYLSDEAPPYPGITECTQQFQMFAPSPQCNDNLDNDGDSLTDCEDPDCEGQICKTSKEEENFSEWRCVDFECRLTGGEATPTPTPTGAPSPTPTPTLRPTLTPTPTQIVGDFNGDGKVDLLDFEIFRDLYTEGL